ncbi:glycosyltransferase involved in cell wall biosynthesis [Flavobacteriaceae bacterium MAR_2010_72]|nr:glycosyltransferase involved in cell wall biosynthesis [Flavobacteriaceae bacterium MAR_2010_72]
MKTLLYIGNYLQSKRNNVSSIHVLGPLFASEGYQVLYRSSKINKFLRLSSMLWACVVYRKQVDLVLIDTYSTLNFYYALLCSQLCRLLGLPYICCLNGGNLPHRLKHSPYLSGLIFDHAKVCVAPSLYLKNAFEYHGYIHVTYIPNTIELKHYPLSSRDFEAPKLLWVRSFSSIYNPQLAVRVLKALRDQGYDASLCMVGPDSDGSLAEVKHLAKTLGVNVHFTGKLTKAEWIALSKSYTIFINTTNYDNTPVSVIEAMALGLPVVSTNVGGMPFLIEDGVHGLLVPPDDAVAMSTAIASLFEDPQGREALIAAARQRIEQYDWQQVRLLWLEVIG